MKLHCLMMLLQTWTNVVAGSSMSYLEHSAHVADTPSEAELSSRLHKAPVEQSEVLTQALQHIESLRSSSSCSRIAAMTLLQSCQSLDSNPGQQDPHSDIEFGLDRVKIVYSTRLAACELAEAKLDVPSQCADFIPRRPPCNRIRRWTNMWFRAEDDQSELSVGWCYPETGQMQVAACLKTLESRPQYWTSYSNAKQNAVVICHASRTAIDKDRDLNSYKSLVMVTQNVTSDITKAQEQVKEIMAALKQLRQDFTHGLDTAATESRGIIAQMNARIQSASQSLVDSLLKASKVAHRELDNLKTNTQDARSDIDILRKNIQELQTEMSSTMTELAATQQTDFEHGQVAAANFLNSVAASYAIISQLMSAANGSLEILELMNEKQDQIQRNQENLETSQVNMVSRFQTLSADITNASQSLEIVSKTFSAFGIVKAIAAFFVTLVTIFQCFGIVYLMLTNRLATPLGLATGLLTGVLWTALMSMLFSGGSIKDFVVIQVEAWRVWMLVPVCISGVLAIACATYLAGEFLIRKARSTAIAEIDGGHFIKIEMPS